MKYFGWVFLFFIAVYVLPLGSRPLALYGEYSFAETAREMVLSGDYTVARTRGKVQIDTPAPSYYPAAKGIQLFGKNSFAVRFPSALAVGLTALFIWILVKQVLRDEKLAALSSVIYLSFAMIYASGTVAGREALQSMLCVGCCGCMFMVFQEDKFNRRKFLNLILCGIFLGLGFISGTFDALFVPFLTGLGYAIWDRKLRQLPLIWLGSLAIAALVALPWGIAINRAIPGFWSHEIYETCQAFIPKPQNLPFYSILFFFILGSFPGALLIPAAGVVGREAWQGFLRQPLFRFAFCFMILPLIFFSFHCHFGILPCFAPLALLIAAGIRVYFNSGGHHRSYNWIMTLWGVFLVISGIALVILNFVKLKYSHLIPVTPLFYPVMGGVLIFAGAVMLYSVTGNWRGRLYLFFFGIGLIMLFIPWFFRTSPLMPGEALQKVREKIMRYPTETTIIAARNPRIAVAAAWEFDDKDICTVDEINISKPCTTIAIIDDKISDSDFSAAGFTLNETIIKANPSQILLLDLKQQKK